MAPKQMTMGHFSMWMKDPLLVIFLSGHPTQRTSIYVTYTDIDDRWTYTIMGSEIHVRLQHVKHKLPSVATVGIFRNSLVDVQRQGSKNLIFSR